MVLKHHGRVVADLPIDPLAKASARIRPALDAVPAKRPVIDAADVIAPPVLESLVKLMGSPDLASRRWIWEQYDHMVMADTVQRPGGDAAVVRVHGSKRGLAITSDVTPRYCAADPLEGGKQAVAEACRNLCAVGARPLAVTDNLNFGNPEKPEIMGQIVEAIDGMGEACRALDFPVVSGNVSLYNETEGGAIPPTPAIGAVGLLDDVCLHGHARLQARRRDDHPLWARPAAGSAPRSICARSPAAKRARRRRSISHRERRNGDFVRGLIAAGEVSAVHDVSDGGLLVALAEMALWPAASARGSIRRPPCPLHAWCFGEDQGRYVVTAASPVEAAAVIAAAQAPTWPRDHRRHRRRRA